MSFKNIFLLFSFFLLNSCMFRHLRNDVETLEKIWEIYGEVAMPDSIEGQLVAAVFKLENDTCSVASYKIIDPSVKLFAILLNPGNYRFALIHDRDCNLKIDHSESVYLHNNGNRLKFSDVVKRINLLELAVPESGSLPAHFSRNLNGSNQTNADSYKLAFGEMVDWDNECFSEETGHMGLWEPNRYLHKCGAGIYWQKNYDPDRIPVLFVSGAGGSIQEWNYFFKWLDQKTFQPWYFMFPSGIELTTHGINLSNWIDIMHEKCGFERIYLIAHSMGGLVGRYAVLHSIEKNKTDSTGSILIKKFITISTPWNGHKMAKKGVENVSVPIPAWHDIIPGSPFLETLFDTPIKPFIDHHLLFGYTAHSGNDGSVALESVLLEEAQNDAVEVHAFKGDHVGILMQNEVLEYVQNILYDAEKRFKKENAN